jgi:hypothetical protein
MPVTTPVANVRAKMRAQNRAVVRLARPQLDRLHHRNHHAQPHRQDGEQVVEHDGEGELPPGGGDGVGHTAILLPSCRAAERGCVDLRSSRSINQ